MDHSCAAVLVCECGHFLLQEIVSFVACQNHEHLNVNKDKPMNICSYKKDMDLYELSFLNKTF